MFLSNNPASVKQVIAEATSELHAACIETARLDASLLLAHALGVKRENLLLEPERSLEPFEITKFSEFVERRKKCEPVAYIIGKKEFWSLDFIVTRDTLIPRPDSEAVVEATLERAKSIAQKLVKPLGLAEIRIIDIGVGTGCLLVALLKEMPMAQGVGVDISEPALKVAESNAKNHGVEKRIQFIRSNWCDKAEGEFDFIISNPPYIAHDDFAHLMKDVADYEPYTALVSGVDGLDSYRAIARQARDKLNPGGYVVLEVGQGQAEAVAGLLQENGLILDGIKKDLAGIPRCVIAKKN